MDTQATIQHNPDVEDAIDCPCSDCVQSRREFDAWCSATEARWAARRNVLDVVTGDERDTSYDRARLGVAS